MEPLTPEQTATAARRYLFALRWHYRCLISIPLPFVIGAIFPSSGLVFASMFACFLVCVLVVVATAMYLGDFECPQCRIVYSCRRTGDSGPLDCCMNFGLSLKAAARNEPCETPPPARE